MKHRISTILDGLEHVVYIIVALLLVAMSGYTIVDAVRSFSSVSFSSGVTYSLTGILNDALFIIILMELLRTVISHLAEGGFQLRPFLIIGIISSVRRILVLGAQLSTSRHGTTQAFDRSLEELALDAAVAVALTIALYVVQRLRREESQRRGNPTSGSSVKHHDIVADELLGTEADEEQL